METWYVYLARGNDGRLDAGVTSDLARFVDEHLVYWERFHTKGKALRREAEVKRWTKAKRELLVRGVIGEACGKRI